MNKESTSYLNNRIRELEHQNNQLKDQIKRLEQNESSTFYEKWFHNLFDSMLEGVCEHELVYNDSGEVINYRILYTNPAYESNLGIKGADVIGKLATEAYQTNEPPFLNIYTRVVKTQKPEQFEAYLEQMSKHFMISVFSKEKEKFTTIFTNITEIKKTEEELAIQKERMNNIIEGGAIGTWEWNIQTGEIIINERSAKILGYNPQKNRSLDIDTITNMFHPEDLKIASTALHKYFKGECDYYECELRMLHKDGHWIWLQNKGKLRAWTDNKKSRWMFGIILDITKRINTENALKESEEKHRFLFENMPHGAVYHSSTGEIFYANEAASRILGLTFDQLYGRTSVDPRWKAIHEDGSPFPGETHPAMVTLKTGKPVFNKKMGVFNPQKNALNWININSLPKFKKNQSKPYQVVATFEDITDGEQARLHLQRNEEELIIKNQISNTFINSETENFYKEVLDIIREVFSSEYGYFGYINNEGDFVAKSLTSDVWKECQIEDKSIVFSKDSWGGLWGKSLKKRKTLYKNENLKLPEGHVHLESAIACPIISNNKLIGQIALANKTEGYDENDKKLINRLCNYIAPLLHAKIQEEQYKQNILEAKEKAEESDRLKSAFLANMSHEIRTPMNGIMNFSKILLEQEYPKNKQERFLNIINSQARHLLQIINDIVDISKIDVNLLSLNYEDFNLNDVMNELLNVHTKEMTNKGKQNITLKLKNELEDENCTINSDYNRIKQILNNLLNNAIKHTNEGTIEFGYELQSDNYLLLYVTDTGPGIPQDQQKKIFDRFHQVENRTKHNIEGTGLGLNIAQNLVTLLGGEMWVKSETGEGTTFYFTLPYEARSNHQNNEKKQEIKENLDWNGKTCLIIDDDPVSHEYLQEILESNGFNVILCPTGQAGYDEFLKNPHIDLILMDIKLPDIGGLEIVQKIRSSDNNNNKVPIIAQTAYALNEYVTKSRNAGCNEYISKPFDITKLEEKINKLLS